MLAFGALAAVSLLPIDLRWTGMLSAFPLPGIFALATLSATLDAGALRDRDTVLMGTLLVIPFNVLFAEIVLGLPVDAPGFLLLGSLWGMLFWLIRAAGVFGGAADRADARSLEAAIALHVVCRSMVAIRR